MTDPEKAPAGLSQPHLIRGDAGLTTVEYVIISILMAAVAMAAWQQFGAKLEGTVQGATSPRDSPAADATSPSNH
jgi:Flp pilus assembly pilin Flp